jgi:glucosamine kinase
VAERFVFGFDGGQTGTTCLLARSDGAILGRGTGGHLLHLSLPAGRNAMRVAFEQCTSEAWRMAGISPQPCAAAYLGLSGVETGTREAAIAEQIAAETVGAGKIVAANDGTSALAGALLGQPGVVVIAGTGAIALGANETGVQAFAGGWGWLLGDEGSAFDLGRRGLLAAVHAWDGRGPSTLLAVRLQAHFGVDYYFDVKRIIFSSPLDARLFADLAPIVVQAAQDGDSVARTIVSDGAHELARAAAAVIMRLGFTLSTIPVSYAGGVFRAGPIVLKPFAHRLRRLEPRARLVAPALPGSCGSLLLALRACGDLNDAAIARLLADARRRGWSNIE